MLYALGDQCPQLDAGASWVAPTAVVIGDVVLARNVSIWWGAVLRGDNERIAIGENSNIQENAVLHVDPGFPLTVGAGVTVGHLAMLHGCAIGDDTLIGIGSIVLNGATIGRDCLIGANTFIPEGKSIPDGSVVFGSPGRVVKEVTPELRQRIRQSAEAYVARRRRYRDELRSIG